MWRTFSIFCGLFLIFAAFAGDPPSVVAYEKDKNQAELIAIEANRIWEKLPDQPAEISGHSLKELEAKILTSQNKWLVYFRNNRKYFTLETDLGGGISVAPNWNRLKEGTSTKEGLDAYHRYRIREVSNVPYCPAACELGNCGDADEADSAGALLALFEKVLTDFPQPEFRQSHRAILADYRRSVDEFLKGKRDSCEGSSTSPGPKVKDALAPLVRTVDRLEKKIGK